MRVNVAVPVGVALPTSGGGTSLPESSRALNAWLVDAAGGFEPEDDCELAHPATASDNNHRTARCMESPPGAS